MSRARTRRDRTYGGAGCGSGCGLGLECDCTDGSCGGDGEVGEGKLLLWSGLFYANAKVMRT